MKGSTVHACGPHKPPKCFCRCGYICGGPGSCDIWLADATDCINQHFKKDCGHDFSGPMVDIDGGSTITCKHCGMHALDHDMWVGQ